MRIALYGDALIRQNAGVYYYTLDFYTRLIKEFPNHKYFLILPEAFNGLENCTEIIVSIRTYIPLHSRIRQFVDIPKAVNKLNVDLAIEPAHFGPFFLKKSIRRFTIIHDLTPINYPKYHKSIDVWMHKLLLKSVLEKADCVIVNSQTTESDVHQYAPLSNSKTTVVYPSLVKDSILNKTLPDNLEITKKYILSVGTLEPRKNHIAILKAFIKFRDRINNYQLVIVGKRGWKNEEMDNYVRKLEQTDSIIFTGYVKRNILWSLYNRCSLFVYASHFEGFGLPVMEAMSEGAVSLISNIPSLRELAGKAAIFFEPQNTEELADKMYDIINDQNELKKYRSLAFERYQFLQSRAKESVVSFGNNLGL